MALFFRIHYEALAYESLVYIKKSSDKPKEVKYKQVWVEGYAKCNFKSNCPGEIVHVDIKYVKFEAQWWYLHVMKETFGNKVLKWDINQEKMQFHQ